MLLEIYIYIQQNKDSKDYANREENIHSYAEEERITETIDSHRSRTAGVIILYRLNYGTAQR